MGGFLTPPTWAPPQPPIPIGATGDVLTVQPNRTLRFAPGGGGGSGNPGTGFVVYDLPNGESDNLDPIAGWPGSGATQYGRLILEGATAAANITGLLAGNDNQYLLIVNNTDQDVTLNSESASSLAANQFLYLADFVLVPGQSVLVVYDEATLEKWLIT